MEVIRLVFLPGTWLRVSLLGGGYRVSRVFRHLFTVEESAMVVAITCFMTPFSSPI